jgi:8-oxo-dGTP pyrophosphatase MutT (NUDIX family)
VYPDDWEAVRELVRANDNCLSQTGYAQVQRLFLAAGSMPAALTREWERNEFMLVVAEDGHPAIATAFMLDQYQRTLREHAGFARWFKPSRIPSVSFVGQPVLLANRWLCHLAGLRHQTVEIFIDPPDLPAFTLVQVRGMEKFEAPGSFDIPCAGHVSELDGAVDALAKELGEELNLSLEDLRNFRLVARYDSVAGLREGPRNNEYRYLYQAQLRPESISKIAFSDGEVAALCVFALPELQALVERFPERIASGLGDAMKYYTA